jgi:hypothetical protein
LVGSLLKLRNERCEVAADVDLLRGNTLQHAQRALRSENEFGLFQELSSGGGESFQTIVANANDMNFM